MGKYHHFRLIDFPGEEDSALHDKVNVVDHRLALIGSSNESRRGLLTNHELAVIMDGDAAGEVDRAMDALIDIRTSSEYSQLIDAPNVA